MLTNAQQQEHAINTPIVLTLTAPSLAHIELESSDNKLPAQLDIQVTDFTAKILMNVMTK